MTWDVILGGLGLVVSIVAVGVSVWAIHTARRADEQSSKAQAEENRIADRAVRVGRLAELRPLYAAFLKRRRAFYGPTEDTVLWLSETVDLLRLYSPDRIAPPFEVMRSTVPRLWADSQRQLNEKEQRDDVERREQLKDEIREVVAAFQGFVND